MPKDNENILFLGDEPIKPSEPAGFAPDQMVRCEECLRANPPTRLNCLYCAATLPLSEGASDSIVPNFKPIESWEMGFNNIFLPDSSSEPIEQDLHKAANLLKLNVDEVSRLVATKSPMPLTRTATFAEASEVTRRLKELALETAIISDQELGLKQSPIRLRALSFDENGLMPKKILQSEEPKIPWSHLVFMLTGRLSTQRVELRERKQRRGENEIIETNEFFADDSVVDLYCRDPDVNFRIAANGFDFSCLSRMKLLAAENFSLLLEELRAKARGAAFDDSYDRYRPLLEAVWPAEQHTASQGLRRERPGRYSIGAVTESSNEAQFTRYSRLRYLLRSVP